MNVKERVKEFTKFFGITVSAFEKSIHVTNGYVNSISKSIGIDKIESILEIYPNLNIEWLLTGKGFMLKEDTSVSEPMTVYNLKTDHGIREQRIPLYDLEATAGVVELFRNTNGKSKPIDYISIPNLPKCDGAIYVTGDSMYPLLKSGDIIMYKELENSIDNIFFGEMYLVSIDLDGDEFVTVKWIHKSDKGDEFIKIVSQNSHHQAKDIHLSNIKAMALIKASIRINSMS